jgi:hypothetical protein
VTTATIAHGTVTVAVATAGAAKRGQERLFRFRAFRQFIFRNGYPETLSRRQRIEFLNSHFFYVICYPLSVIREHCF